MSHTRQSPPPQRPMQQDYGWAIPRKLEPTLQHAITQLFPEFPPWGLGPLMGVPHAPIDLRARLGHLFPSRPRRRASLRVELDIDVPWRESPRRLRSPSSNDTEYILAVEGFELSLSAAEGQLQLVRIYYRDSLALPIFNSSYVFGFTTPRGEEWRCLDSGQANASQLPSEVHGALLRRWASIPQATDREILRRHWVGHAVPALAALGMSTFGPTSPRRRV
jgi:hypothetical protein